MISTGSRRRALRSGVQLSILVTWTLERDGSRRGGQYTPFGYCDRGLITAFVVDMVLWVSGVY